MSLMLLKQSALLLLICVNGIYVIEVKKCCREEESLDLSTNACQRRISASLPSRIQALNLSRTQKDRVVEIDVTFSKIGKPVCKKLEQHFIEFANRTASYTRYGSRCKTACDKRGQNYFWCSTDTGWEYCSPSSKHTINNEVCQGSCTNKGASYYWCWVSPTEKDLQTCNTSPRWDYCSPQLRGQETWITALGSIVTSRYESTFPHGDFCIDNSFSSASENSHFTEDTTGTVALLCDPCEGNKMCLNLCCPHGEAFKDTGAEGCSKHAETIPWDPRFWNHQDNSIIYKERNQDYVLVSANKNGVGFECSNAEEHLLPAETDIADFKVLSNSTLEAKYSSTDPECSDGTDPTSPGGNNSLSPGGNNSLSPGGNNSDCTSTEFFTADRYCLYFGKDLIDYSYDYGDYSGDGSHQLITEEHEGSGVTPENVFSWMYCQKVEKPEIGEEFTRDFYPVALLISAFFLLLTLLVYSVESSLRSGLFGKLTIGFITNIFVGYLILSINSLGNFNAETKSCVVIGYITQYTFLSFFFWVNAITVYICNKYISRKKTSSRPDLKRRSFIKFLIYAQGTPLLIVLITILVDKYGQQAACLSGNIATLSLPNMGVFSCFLGSQFTSDQSFFTKPEFIYFQVFLLLLNIINIICFAVTVYRMTQIQNEYSSFTQQKKRKENIFMALKLFIIMGIPWIFEFISSLLAHNHGLGSTFWIRIFLDLPNLFTGLLIFVVLVCKKNIVTSLVAKLKGAAHLSTNTVKWDSVTKAWLSFSQSSEREDEDGLTLAEMQPNTQPPDVLD